MSNTLSIQISLTIVETLGGTTSVDLWFRSLSLLGGHHKEGRSRGTGHDPTSLNVFVQTIHNLIANGPGILLAIVLMVKDFNLND